MVMKYPFWKRLLDVIGAVSGLLLITPLLPIIALAIKLDSRGPIIVALDRISEGKKIKVYKFRSMFFGSHSLKSNLAHLNERKDGPFFKIKNDPRITRVGKLLRKLKIDEFPQLINVLRGELSLVGPRPHEPEEVQNYPEDYEHLLLAKAGVTGLSQVSGASSLPYLKELELDSWYIKNYSFATDCKIIGKTIKIIFSDPSGV